MSDENDIRVVRVASSVPGPGVVAGASGDEGKVLAWVGPQPYKYALTTPSTAKDAATLSGANTFTSANVFENGVSVGKSGTPGVLSLWDETDGGYSPVIGVDEDVVSVGGSLFVAPAIQTGGNVVANGFFGDGSNLTNLPIAAAVRQRPTNTADFAALTGQTPFTWATGFYPAIGGDTNASHPVSVVSGVNAEVSADGGQTWAASAAVQAGVANALGLRFTAPQYGATASATLKLNGRLLSLSATSREVDPAADQTAFSAYLKSNDSGSPFRQDRAGVTVAANDGEHVERWQSNSGFGAAWGQTANDTDWLDVHFTGTELLLQGRDTIPFALFGFDPATDFTLLFQGIILANDTGGHSFAGPGWSAAAGFLHGNQGQGNQLLYTDDSLGLGLGAGAKNLGAKVIGTPFWAGIKRQSGLISVSGDTLSWVTAGTNAGLVVAPNMGTAFYPLGSLQRLRRYVYLPFTATQTSINAIVAAG